MKTASPVFSPWSFQSKPESIEDTSDSSSMGIFAMSFHTYMGTKAE